ncbi:hypothetical protein C469_00390 [Halorubrum lipolyticum DSM 21995]|uniref:Zinc-ribbon domain-containing protein n=1 Tax=Halorubrum lipolyticum DSM 21995 TaxID=1227482 RepID=M0P4D7_9EURY|nr:hypothetical protein C469_00390 [Halorubrum lipolyticum DSM 21995]
MYAVREIVQFDACPTCNSKVAATSERFCSTCGARLDALEAAPPIDDRVDERFRPVGLEELERREPPEREPNPVADGGEREEHKEDR